VSDGTERVRKLSGPFPRLVREGFAESYPGQESWNALRQQNELILNAAGEGIYGLDLHGRTTFANPAAAAMTGHNVEELLGKSMHDIVHHSHESGECYGRYDCPIYAAFRDGLVRNVCDEVFWR
jgi:PAS domain-containing protein